MAAMLGQFRGEGGLVICAPVYAELLAHPKATPEFVDGFLGHTGIVVEFALGEPIWRQAGGRFSGYARRRRLSAGGAPRRLLVDFLIGAHALAQADCLLSLDPTRYIQDFPELKILPSGESTTALGND